MLPALPVTGQTSIDPGTRPPESPHEVNDLYDSLYGAPGGNVFRRDRYNTFRNSLHILLHWVIAGHYTLDGSGFLQNSLADFHDQILRLTGSGPGDTIPW